MSKAHANMAKVCFGYLSYVDEDLTFTKTESKYPLAWYSARFWVKHAIPAELEVGIQESILDFFLQQREAYEVWCMRCSLDEIWDYRLQAPGETPPPLYHASGLGLLQIVRLLLDKGVSINAQGEGYDTALSVASLRSREDCSAVVRRGSQCPCTGWIL